MEDTPYLPSTSPQPEISAPTPIELTPSRFIEGDAEVLCASVSARDETLICRGLCCLPVCGCRYEYKYWIQIKSVTGHNCDSQVHSSRRVRIYIYLAYMYVREIRFLSFLPDLPARTIYEYDLRKNIKQDVLFFGSSYRRVRRL